MKKLNATNVGVVLLILHAVGVIGYLIPATTPLFLLLTPYNLMLSALALMWFQEVRDIRFAIVALSIITAGYLVEVLGVHTGVIFGEYAYLTTLGWKMFEVPPIIGINWIILVICTASVANKLSDNLLVKVSLAAAAMTIMDMMIEPIAISYQYWEWYGGTVPIQNYVAWFGVAFIFQLLYSSTLKNTNNKIASYLLVAQIIYFGSLNIVKTFLQ